MTKNINENLTMGNCITCKDTITSEDTIIFSPKYNKLLNPKLLANYKKII